MRKSRAFRYARAAFAMQKGPGFAAGTLQILGRIDLYAAAFLASSTGTSAIVFRTCPAIL
jgi:hypothetical protein